MNYRTIPGKTVFPVQLRHYRYPLFSDWKIGAAEMDKYNKFSAREVLVKVANKKGGRWEYSKNAGLVRGLWIRQGVSYQGVQPYISDNSFEYPPPGP